ncbi:MAG: haloacid dehalogenase type II [Gemmatimonadales bacterium]|nr:haloacid dehalogenase type II [Gemmatimonadales bacterium]
MSRSVSASVEPAVLAFDIFGTVVDWRSGIIHQGARLGRRRAIEADWGAVADAWRGRYVPTMRRVNAGELPWGNLDRLHRLMLDEIAPTVGLDMLDEADRTELVHAWHRLPPWPDAVEGLHRLRRRFDIVTLSNGGIALLTHMAKTAALPWDAILSAELVRRYKPERAVYDLVPELFGVPHARVLMVAAHLDDLRAARAAGLMTAYVHRPLEHGPDRTLEIPAEGEFDIMAADFLDLAVRLRA